MPKEGLLNNRAGKIACSKGKIVEKDPYLTP